MTMTFVIVYFFYRDRGHFCTKSIGKCIEVYQNNTYSIIKQKVWLKWDFKCKDKDFPSYDLYLRHIFFQYTVEVQYIFDVWEEQLGRTIG